MRRTLLATGGLAAALALAVSALTVPAGADPQTRPNGPWVKDSQHVSYERLHDDAELAKALNRIERSSQGRVEVESVGTSNEGRDLWLASAGSGDTTLMLVAQQHGNEPLGAEAALQFLRAVGAGGSQVEAWLDEVRVLVMPRLNPDGADRNQRYTHAPGCPGDIYGGAYCSPARGFDMNRYHSPSLTPETNPVVESAAVQQVYETYQPDLMVDYHHQGSYATDDGDMITASTYWPIADGVDPAAVDLSKQTVSLVHDTLMHYGFAEVTQYPGGDFEGIFRNAYGLRGTGSVLVELRGGIGQKSSGMLIRTAYASMFAILESYAEGTLTQIDPGTAEEIPERGDFVTDPH